MEDTKDESKQARRSAWMSFSSTLLGGILAFSGSYLGQSHANEIAGEALHHEINEKRADFIHRFSSDFEDHFRCYDSYKRMANWLAAHHPDVVGADGVWTTGHDTITPPAKLWMNQFNETDVKQWMNQMFLSPVATNKFDGHVLLISSYFPAAKGTSEGEISEDTKAFKACLDHLYTAVDGEKFGKTNTGPIEDQKKNLWAAYTTLLDAMERHVRD